jgi:hypothetical protein
MIKLEKSGSKLYTLHSKLYTKKESDEIDLFFI